MTEEKRVKRFRSVDEMMADRVPTKIDLMNQAMRDLRDPYMNYDLPVTEQVKPALFRPRRVDDEIDQLKGQVQWLTNKITELRAEKKKPGFEPF